MSIDTSQLQDIAQRWTAAINAAQVVQAAVAVGANAAATAQQNAALFLDATGVASVETLIQGQIDARVSALLPALTAVESALGIRRMATPARVVAAVTGS